MSVDLSTRYLGLELKNPLVVSASSLTARLDMLRRLEDAGAAAAVLPSLFEEQIEHDEMELYRLYEFASDSSPEASSYLPELAHSYNTGPDHYMRLIEDAKQAVSMPVIASLNGTSVGGWIRHARLIEEAGADALELNIYEVVTDPALTAAQVEEGYIDLVSAVRSEVSIPVAVKVGPYFSAFPGMAQRLIAAGADGLVLFNRFLQPDIDLETLRVTPNLVLSTSAELRLPLRWVAILRPQIEASLAASTGVETDADILKLLLVGADVTMFASTLFRNGTEHVGTLLAGVKAWMEEKEYESVAQLKGSLSHRNCPDPSAFERANYIKQLVSYTGPAI